MAIDVKFMRASKARNSTKIPEYGSVSAIPCNLKEPCSVQNPVLQVHIDNVTDVEASWNHCYIPIFRRYYWIEDMTAVTAHVWEISCAVDVLATFRTEIRSTNAFIQYSNTLYNGSITDQRLAVTTFVTEETVKVEWPQADTDVGSFCLAMYSANTDGKNGFCALYALDPGKMSQLAGRMLDDSLWEWITADAWIKPADAVISCVWLPIRLPSVVDGSGGNIMFIKNDSGVMGAYAKPLVEGSLTITPYVPYRDPETGDASDFRNFSPCTEYYVLLPGVGAVDIPADAFIIDGVRETVTAKFAVSTADGGVTWELTAGSMNDPFLVVMGNIATQIPLAGSDGAFYKFACTAAITAVSAGITASIGGMMIGNAAGEALSAAKGRYYGLLGASMINNSMQQAALSLIPHQNTYGASGNLGGRTIPELNNSVQCVTRMHKLSDEPNMIRSTVGRPYYHHGNLGSCSGFVQATGAHVKSWATPDESAQITAYIGGGILIE